MAPNFSAWAEGDIVVVGNDGTAAGNLITVSQHASLSPVTRVGAYFTHAALYVGNGRLIDSTTADGISERSAWDYCRHRELELRRLPGLAPGQGSLIATMARTHVGKPYSWLAVIVSKIYPTEPDPSHMYCSTLVGLVVAQATGFQLASARRFKPLHPGTLAAHPGLEVVALEWRPV
jgi:cell wall-associated NlpC family hydrolase